MSNNPTKKKEWGALKKHAALIQNQSILSFFQDEPKRFNELSCSFEGLFFDYSKQHLNDKTIENLCDFAKESGIEEKRNAMFKGEKINHTEGRAVLHTALRKPEPKTEIQEALEKIKRISSHIRTGTLKGATGKSIEKIVSIGIGGSDLGPRLVCDALKSSKDFPVLFVSNVDCADITETLKKCDPETTMFIVISKSFGTQETLYNYRQAKAWLTDSLSGATNIMQHFITISANKDAVLTQGFEEALYLPMWEWVNGRFSVWSAVGLPIAIALGFEKFQEFLHGAHKIDQHFKEEPFESNIPVLMALIGLWNINFLHYNQHALLPYAQELFYFPSYLQQLDMESNGKSVDLDNNFIKEYKTGPVIFGEIGTNGQHSFYQHLHQGTQTVPCDFIGFKNKNADLMNNMLAQSQAMMSGQSHENPHQYFRGNIPSSTLLFDTLNPETLGMLLAIYEHKIFVQGILWNINSFDQFGVELGKKLAKNLEKADLGNTDPSTRGLFEMINK